MTVRGTSQRYQSEVPVPSLTLEPLPLPPPSPSNNLPPSPSPPTNLPSFTFPVQQPPLLHPPPRQPDRSDSTVLFWNIRTDERSIKYFKQLLAIRASTETCVIATHADDSSGQYVLVLSNVIGSPLDAKYIDFEPQYLIITPHHVIAANGTFVYVWQYRTLMSKLTSVDLGTGSLREPPPRMPTPPHPA